jgi:hypothetical protein
MPLLDAANLATKILLYGASLAAIAPTHGSPPWWLPPR